MVFSADYNEMGLQQLAKILTSLKYNEIMSVTTLLTDSPSGVDRVLTSLGYNVMSSFSRPPALGARAESTSL
jgi:hypothetical protein